MTDQATPDYNAALSDARTATRNAQALADGYKATADRLREENEGLRRERDEQQARWEVLTEQYTQEALRRSQAEQERRALCDVLSAARIYVDRMTIQVGPVAHDELHDARRLLLRIDAVLLGAALTPGAAGEGET